jgi:AbiV family abortive infection protein
MALSIIALEEIGKYQSLSNALFYRFFDEGNDESFIADFLRETYDHRTKQRAFLNQGWHDVMYKDMRRMNQQGLDFKSIFLRFFDKRDEPNIDDPEFGKYFPNLKEHYEQLHSLETLKQNSFYVGYPKKRGIGSDLSVRLRTPFQIGRKKAEDQITTLNDHFLLDALRVLKGVSSFEYYEEEIAAMITPKYVRGLKQSWPKIAHKNRKLIEELTQMPTDKESTNN